MDVEKEDILGRHHRDWALKHVWLTEHRGDVVQPIRHDSLNSKIQAAATDVIGRMRTIARGAGMFAPVSAPSNLCNGFS